MDAALSAAIDMMVWGKGYLAYKNLGASRSEVDRVCLWR